MATYELSTNNTLGTPQTPQTPQTPSLYNLTTVLQFAKKTEDKLSIAAESDPTYLVVISVGLLVMFVLYVILQYRSKRSSSCCLTKREDQDLLPRVFFGTHETDYECIDALSKGSLPPPYEHPPSYQVAAQMESFNGNEKKKNIS